MATWFKVILNILLAVALIACSVVVTIYTDIFDKNKKYTYRDLEEAYETGYSKASAIVADLQTKIDELEESNVIKQQQIQNLQAQIKVLQDTISELEIDNQNKQTQITELQNTITQKNAEIDNLNAEIERLKTELEVYTNQELDFVYVTFYVDNEVYKTISIRKEGSILIDIAEPVKEGYIFQNWILNEAFVDIKNYIFTENTRIDAKFTREFAEVIINVTLVGYPEVNYGCEAGFLQIINNENNEFVYLEFNYDSRNIDSNETDNFYYFKGSKTIVYKIKVGSYKAYSAATLDSSCSSDVSDFEITSTEDNIYFNIVLTCTA